MNEAAAFRGPVGVFAVILLELALGSLAVLYVTPVWGVVKRGYFLLVGSTVLVGALGAALVARTPLTDVADPDLATATLWLFAGVAALFVVALLMRRVGVARVIGAVGVPVGVAAVCALAMLRGDGGTTVKGAVAMLTGAAFLGATWDGMVLGHWYLVDRKLTARPMQAAALAFSIGVGLAVVSALLAKGGDPTPAENTLNPLLFVSGLTLYLAVGLVAVNALLAFFVHKLVGEGSIRAATGMLYLAVIMAFSAELAAKARFFSL